MTDLRQSPAFARFLEQEGWQSEIIGQGWAYFRKLPLVPFSIAKYQRPKKANLNKYFALARKYRAVRIYFEPQAPSGATERAPRGWSIQRFPFLPTKTLEIDLIPSLAKIEARMKKDTRYGIRRAEGKGTKVQRYKGTPQLNNLRKAWQKACLENVSTLRYLCFLGFLGFFSPNPPPTAKTLANLAKAFGNKAVFLTAVKKEPRRKEKTPKETIGALPGWKKSLLSGGEKIVLGGAIILIADKTAYYYRAFTTKEGRTKYAQYLIVWEAIRLAKKQGCRIFDFEGVFDPRFPVKNWQGFSHFKKSFGGKEVCYPGCFTTTPRRLKRSLSI